MIKPILVHLIVEYDYKEIMLMIGQCGLATLLACIFPVASFKILDPNSVIGFLGIGLTCMISLGLVIWFIGLDKYMKKMLLTLVQEKLIKHRKE